MAKVHITLETGTVLGVEHRPDCWVALVAMDPPEGGEERCATCRMCAAKKDCERVLEARVDEAETDMAKGTRVEVEIARPSLYFPMLLTLVVPLVAVVAGGILGSLVGKGTEWRELLTAAYALWVGMLALLGVYRWLRAEAGAYNPSVKVRRVL